MFDNNSSLSHRLVGKYFTADNSIPPPSFDETERSLRKQWSLSTDDDMTIQILADDTFLFKFRQEGKKQQVLLSGPYYINGIIIVIKDPSSSSDKNIDFTVASFLVGVLGLPSYIHMKQFLPYLKSLLGDNKALLVHKKLDQVICFLVDVDLKKPLRPGFYVGEYRFVEFKYRNLGDLFCYKCGMIGHIEKSCDKVRSHKKRALNATSETNEYGPWLKADALIKQYKMVITKSPDNAFLESEKKTLSYAQFFIEIEYNNVYYYEARSFWAKASTHRFRFPCSFLGDIEETESRDFVTSRVYRVIEKEIYENSPFSLTGFGDKDCVIKSLVDKLKLYRKYYFVCDDKWLMLDLKVNIIANLTPVDFETLLAIYGDVDRERLIEDKISDLIKKRVENNEDLLSLSTWENQINEAISEMGFSRYVNDVSTRADKAMREAVRMEISSKSCPKPADSCMVSRLERFKVLGDDMDRLDPCVICVNEMFLGKEATALTCSHVFHSSCIQKWFQVGHKCPLCGFKLLSSQQN